MLLLLLTVNRFFLENEDPNKQFEKQTSFVSDSEEKRDKTKEEVEKESEAKEKSKSAGKGKEQSTPKGPQVGLTLIT